MKFNAFILKKWIIGRISPMGWSVLISRALPELLEVNANFSAFYINKHTKWGNEEVQIIQWYLFKLYEIELPDQILEEYGELEVNYFDLVSFDFFERTRKSFSNLKKSFLNLLKV